MTEDSEASSVFDSVFISMSDTLNSINTLASSDQTPEDRPLNTTTLITTPSRDTLRYAAYRLACPCRVLTQQSMYNRFTHIFSSTLHYTLYCLSCYPLLLSLDTFVVLLEV